MEAVLWIAAFAAVVLATGVAYQFAGDWRDRKRYAADGRWVTIGNGAKLFLFEMGAGEPTILFEAGIGATHLNWRAIQDSIADSARTVSYDRGGLGWSSRCRSARIPGNIAVELHQMLHRAGLKPPFILVGHSFGGLVMRRYAVLYPDEVAGVVLIDPMRIDQWPPIDPSKQSQIDLGRRLIRFAMPVATCGLARLMVTLLFCRASRLSDQIVGAAGAHKRHVLTRIKTEVRKMPRAVWPAVAAHWSRPGFYAGIRSHISSIPATVMEMDAVEPIRDIPVTVLTPANAGPLSQDHLDRIADGAHQVIAYNSDHWIHLDEPELVIDSIRSMVAAAIPETALAD
ncbi:MAG TPA: alpha/beta hydrolase [Terracidiphilus sp.]|jgi:pimeloyl-ACP methyl ester carboxylesterase